MPGVPREFAEHHLNVDLKYKRSSSFCTALMRKGVRRLERKWPGSWPLALLWKYFTRSGWLTRCLFLIRMARGGCVWITRISIKSVRLIRSPSPVLIKSLMQRQVVRVCASGRLFRLSPNQDGSRGPREDVIYHAFWGLLFCYYAFWA